jgi:O-antigen/teichoic acid export membrane protein
MAIAGSPDHAGSPELTPAAPEARREPHPRPGVTDSHPHTVSPARTVARGALALLTAQPLTWASTLVLIVLLPRYLTDVEFGQAALGANLAALVGPICTLGLLDHLARSLSGRLKHELGEVSAALVITSATAGVLSLMLAACVIERP